MKIEINQIKDKDDTLPMFCKIKNKSVGISKSGE